MVRICKALIVNKGDYFDEYRVLKVFVGVFFALFFCFCFLVCLFVCLFNLYLMWLRKTCI